MAKPKLQQIELTSGNKATQPPFPGGWVLAIFDALSCFAPALADKHELPTSQRTQERIKAARPVKQRSYEKIESKLVELVASLFPKVSAVNGFAQKYVDEYFRLWKRAAEIAPTWVKCLGFKPGESSVLGRALVRDLVLRLRSNLNGGRASPRLMRRSVLSFILNRSAKSSSEVSKDRARSQMRIGNTLVPNPQSGRIEACRDDTARGRPAFAHIAYRGPDAEADAHQTRYMLKRVWANLPRYS